ncbi:MAG: hypothetical protein ACPGED_06525 [Flavobacteriales bacterium]
MNVFKIQGEEFSLQIETKVFKAVNDIAYDHRSTQTIVSTFNGANVRSEEEIYGFFKKFVDGYHAANWLDEAFGKASPVLRKISLSRRELLMLAFLLKRHSDDYQEIILKIYEITSGMIEFVNQEMVELQDYSIEDVEANGDVTATAKSSDVTLKIHKMNGLQKFLVATRKDQTKGMIPWPHRAKPARAEIISFFDKEAPRIWANQSLKN